jgi:hypothetical protein
MGRRYANEDWRNDPQRRQAAYDLHADWVSAVDAAEGHLKAALAEFANLPVPDDGGMAALVRAFCSALYHAQLAAERIPRTPASDTLVGNMAAFGEGCEVPQ